MTPRESIPIGPGSLDLYPAAANSAPAPWVSARQLWDLVLGERAPGFHDFLKTWGNGTGPHLVRAVSAAGVPLMLIAPAAAWDILNQAPADLDPAIRTTIEMAFAVRTADVDA